MFFDDGHSKQNVRQAEHTSQRGEYLFVAMQ
jgi:hypothetical protein